MNNNISQGFFLKTCIQKTLNLSMCADSRNDTIKHVKRSKNLISENGKSPKSFYPDLVGLLTNKKKMEFIVVQIARWRPQRNKF